jgi:GTP cyclohydrolase I
MNDEIDVLVEKILVAIGEDPNRGGLRGTPNRVSKAIREMCKGYTDPDFTLTAFDCKYTGLVSRPYIPFYSICEHHMLPYSGYIHFSYMPNGKVVGASKILRFMEHHCSKLTIQEELTDFLLDTFMKQVEPKGAMIIIEASHLCEACRGVRKPNVPFVTQSVRGDYMIDADVKSEFEETISRWSTRR